MNLNKEIEAKYEASEINATYKFKRTLKDKHVKTNNELEGNKVKPTYTISKEHNRKNSKRDESNSHGKEENIYSTFNEKILLKNKYNYEKAITGTPGTEFGNPYYEEGNTFDYKPKYKDLTDVKQKDTFYSENNWASKQYQGHETSGTVGIINYNL